jgi:hypothetical protein
VVVLVIFLFLRNLPATFIPSVACRVAQSARSACVPGGLFHQQPALMALTIATGFVVDDAIVVIENIARATSRPGFAAPGGIEGTQQIAFDHFADVLTPCGSHPPAVHGRRPAFPPVAITLAVSIRFPRSSR